MFIPALQIPSFLKFKAIFWIGTFLVTIFLYFGESVVVERNAFQNFSPVEISVIFQFLDWDDFYKAIMYFNIVKPQAQYFPKYSFRKYGSLTTEFYPHENGSKIYPPSIKQMVIFEIIPRNPLHVILYHNGDLESKFSGEIIPVLPLREESNCFHHVDSFFIDYIDLYKTIIFVLHGAERSDTIL